MTNINLTRLLRNDPEHDALGQALAGVYQIAKNLPCNTEVTITLTVDQICELFPSTSVSVSPLQTEEQETSLIKDDADKIETSPIKEVAEKSEPPKKIRRTKEETEAGLSLEQAREFRSSGLKMAEFLKELADDGEEPGTTGDPLAELEEASARAAEESLANEKPASEETAAETAKKLAEQPSMSTPPEGPVAGTPTVTEADLRQIAGELLATDKANNDTRGEEAIRQTAAKYNAQRLTAIPEDKWGEVVSYLRKLKKSLSSADDLV